MDVDSYNVMRNAATDVTGPLLQQVVEACQGNPWIKVGGAEFEPEGLCCERDYPFYLERYDDVAMLQMFFEHGNWGLRAAVQYRDVVFVNQVNGGDEWWTLKVDGDRLVPFESVSFSRIIRDGEFRPFVERLASASVEQCVGLAY